MTEEHPDTTMISGMESLLKNARICREIIRSQPNRPYEHYWKEFLKTQQVRNALLGDPAIGTGGKSKKEGKRKICNHCKFAYSPFPGQSGLVTPVVRCRNRVFALPVCQPLSRAVGALKH